MSRGEPDGLRVPAVQSVESRDGVTVVRLAGELDLYNAGDVGAALEQAAGEPGRVVVDLTEVEFVDSTALGTLVEARKQLGGDRLVLASPGHDVRRAFEVAGLLQHFRITDSLDEALSGT
ncbi:MAG: STAS domain-containing protein [Jatrophihabitantaceae bacterium]